MTKKASPSAPASPSFDVDLVSANAESAIGAIERAEGRASELIEAWVSAKNVEAVFAIAESDGAPMAARKAARRGLQVLKSRGVTPPERSHVARIAPSERVVEAWMMPPDPGGALLLVLASHTPSRRYDVGRLILQPGVGVLEVGRSDMSGSQLRAWFDDMEKRGGQKPSTVPVDWARARVAEVRASHGKTGYVPPLGLSSMDELLTPVPAAPPAHPIDAAALAIPDPSTVIAASASLHNEPEFGPWLPPNPVVQALFAAVGQRLAQAGTPGAQPPKEVFDKALGDSLDDLTDRFFTPEVRAQVATAMKDAAISVLARTGSERAAEVLAVAQAVVSAGLVTQPPHEVPFLRAFFQKAVAVVAAQSGGQISIPVPTIPGGLAPDAAVEPSGLVTPAEIAAEKAAPGEQVSPGGIILP